MATDENGAPRHGRHAAGRHAAPQPQVPERIQGEAAPAAVPTTVPTAVSAAAPSVGRSGVQAAPTPAAPAAGPDIIPDLVPIIDGDQETSMGDAPRPIGVDPGATGSFSRINASEGARLTTRANASETASFRLETSRPVEAVRMSTAGRPHVEHRETEVKANGRVLALLGIGVVLVIVLVGWLVSKALTSVDQNPDDTVQEQAQATGDEGIEYRGTTYKLADQGSGTWALTSTSEGSEGTAVVCELAGTPVTLVLYNTVFVIPENLPDGTWDLIAHPLGGGSVTQQVTDGDGNPIVREGSIAQARLVDNVVEVTTESGEVISVALE